MIKFIVPNKIIVLQKNVKYSFPVYHLTKGDVNNLQVNYIQKHSDHSQPVTITVEGKLAKSTNTQDKIKIEEIILNENNTNMNLPAEVIIGKKGYHYEEIFFTADADVTVTFSLTSKEKTPVTFKSIYQLFLSVCGGLAALVLLLQNMDFLKARYSYLFNSDLEYGNEIYVSGSKPTAIGGSGVCTWLIQFDSVRVVLKHSDGSVTSTVSCIYTEIPVNECKDVAAVKTNVQTYTTSIKSALEDGRVSLTYQTVPGNHPPCLLILEGTKKGNIIEGIMTWRRNEPHAVRSVNFTVMEPVKLVLK